MSSYNANRIPHKPCAASEPGRHLEQAYPDTLRCGQRVRTIFEELVPAREYTFDLDTGNSTHIPLPGQSLLAVKIVFTQNTGAAGAQVAEAILK